MFCTGGVQLLGYESQGPLGLGDSRGGWQCQLAFVFIVHLLSYSYLMLLLKGLWKFASNNFDLTVTEMYRDLNKRAFMEQARKLIPSCTDDMVEESFAGVMAQVFMDDGSAASDFIFERRLLGGTTLHVRNAPSPACTASMAIAEEVVNIAEQDFSWKKK